MGNVQQRSQQQHQPVPSSSSVTTPTVQPTPPSPSVPSASGVVSSVGGMMRNRAHFFQSVESDAEATAMMGTSGLAQGPRESMTLVVTSGQVLMRLVSKHDTFCTLHDLVSAIVEHVDLLMRDPRFRWYFRGKKTDFAPLLTHFRAIVWQMQQTTNRISDILESLHGSGHGNLHANANASYDDDDDQELDHSESQRAARQRVQQQQQKQENGGFASVAGDAQQPMVNDYLAMRDEAEIMLTHHLNSLTMMQTFLIHQKAAVMGVDASSASIGRSKASPFVPEEGLHILKGDKEARKFWMNNFGAKAFVASKEDFVSAMKAHLKKKWVPEIEILIDPTSDDVISIADFKCFLDWFGPFKKCVANVARLIGYPWFWGSLTSLQSERIMAHEPVGTFVVRFHDSKPGMFLISCVQEDEQQDTGMPFGMHNYADESSVVEGTSETTSSMASADRFAMYRRQTRVFHFNVMRKDAHFMLAEGEPKFTELQHLLEQYSLSFRRPLEDETAKMEQLQIFFHMRSLRNLNVTETTAGNSSDGNTRSASFTEPSQEGQQIPLFFADFRGRISSGDGSDNMSGNRGNNSSIWITRINTSEPRAVSTLLPSTTVTEVEDNDEDENQLSEDEAKPVVVSDPVSSNANDEDGRMDIELPLLSNV